MNYWFETPYVSRAPNKFDLLRVSTKLVSFVIFWLCTTLLLSQAHAQAPTAAQSIKFWNDSEPESVINVNHEPWQALLTKYVNDTDPSGINRFNYAAVTSVDLQRLVDYLDYLQKLEPRQLNPAEQLAYWVNLYNAKIAQLVVQTFDENDPVSSIRQLRSGVFTPGPWKREALKIVFQDLSLDDIEHGILRPNFQDFRIHYVLNSASLGCPNLLKTALNGENNEILLEKAEQDYLNHERAVKIEDGDLVLSAMFDWYSGDFAENKQALLDYLKGKVSPELASAITTNVTTRFDYDWSLNSPDS